jgi:hypothetical protein
MNHNHIYSDSVSCEQLKAVDIISKEEGRFCPTNTLSKNQQQTNEKYTNIVQPCGTSKSTLYFLEYLGVQHITCRMSLGIQLISVSIDSVSTLVSMFRVDLLLSYFSVLCEAVY